jgi:hypothetical protein
MMDRDGFALDEVALADAIALAGRCGGCLAVLVAEAVCAKAGSWFLRKYIEEFRLTQSSTINDN